MPQSITATVNLTGLQPIRYDTHGEQHQAGSLVLLSLAGVLITFYDQRSIEKYAATFVDDTEFLGRRLSREDRELTHYAGSTMTLAHTASHRDDCFVAEATFERLRLRTGPVIWVIHDRNAYADVVAAWMTIRQLGSVVLPDRR